VPLSLKNLSNRMPEAGIREELEALYINMQAGMHLWLKRRGQDHEKDCPVTPHYIVSVARGPAVEKVRPLADLCGLRVKVKTYNAPNGSLQCKRCQRFRHTNVTAPMHYAPKCVACGDAHPNREVCHS
jgi:hypothetical protein